MANPHHEQEVGPCDDRVASGADGSVTLLLGQLKHGLPEVLAEIWRRFFPRMSGLARRTLNGLPKCRSDADDVAQSAFISFWQAVEARNEMEFADRDDFWRLLGVMTVRKARRKVRHEMAQKRGGARTRTESELGRTDDESAFRLDQAMADVSPPEFDLCCEEMLLALDDEHRPVAVLRLQGHSSTEIAEIVGCSPRSVQRALADIRDCWKELDEGG